MAAMATKLKPCPACASQIAKGARACPHCGKAFTNVAGLVLAVLVALLIGGLLFAKLLLSAHESGNELDAIEHKIRSGNR
jgi:hypothetical protein